MDLVCKYFQCGFCKFGESCRKQHVKETCPAQSCTTRSCMKRHPKICKYFLVQKSCIFGEKCLYKHIDSSNQNDISDLKEKIVVLEDSVHVLTLGSDDLKTSQNELKIEMLEDEVKDLRSQIKKLKKITEKLYESVRDIPEVKQCEKENFKDIPDVEPCEKEKVTQNIPVKVRFNCNKCNSSFKKKITLE